MAPANRKQLVIRFKDLPKGVREHLSDARHLLRYDWNYDILIAYLFQKIETAHNMALYCGMVKRHRVDKDLAWNAVQKEHLTREGFKERMAAVFEKKLPRKAASTIKAAEFVRDAIMHGKESSESEKRKAIANLLEYAEQFNEFCQEFGGAGVGNGFKPFGKLRGFAGRQQTLPKNTSRLVVKGLGFNLS